MDDCLSTCGGLNDPAESLIWDAIQCCREIHVSDVILQNNVLYSFMLLRFELGSSMVIAVVKYHDNTA